MSSPVKFCRDCGYHATPLENEAAIDAEGLKAPFCITIGFPDFANMLLDMVRNGPEGDPEAKLVIYEVYLHGATLHPDDDGPPNFRVHTDLLPSPHHYRKIAYMTADDTFVPVEERAV